MYAPMACHVCPPSRLLSQSHLSQHICTCGRCGLSQYICTCDLAQHQYRQRFIVHTTKMRTALCSLLAGMRDVQNPIARTPRMPPLPPMSPMSPMSPMPQHSPGWQMFQTVSLVPYKTEGYAVPGTGAAAVRWHCTSVAVVNGTKCALDFTGIDGEWPSPVSRALMPMCNRCSYALMPPMCNRCSRAASLLWQPRVAMFSMSTTRSSSLRWCCDGAVMVL